MNALINFLEHSSYLGSAHALQVLSQFSPFLVHLLVASEQTWNTPTSGENPAFPPPLPRSPARHISASVMLSDACDSIGLATAIGSASPNRSLYGASWGASTNSSMAQPRFRWGGEPDLFVHLGPTNANLAHGTEGARDLSMCHFEWLSCSIMDHTTWTGNSCSIHIRLAPLRPIPRRPAWGTAT